VRPGTGFGAGPAIDAWPLFLLLSVGGLAVFLLLSVGDSREALVDGGAWVGLADAIRLVRAELLTAMGEGHDEALRFGLGPVEMEFLVEIRRERSVEGGLRAWVISGAGHAGSVAGASHRIKIVLDPEDVEGQRARISSRDGRIPPP
jgi:NTP-dependent ternary system trypsin peptidase co-occuring protein